MQPSVSFYKQFNVRSRSHVGRALTPPVLRGLRTCPQGMTLGLFFAELSVGAIWLLGTRLIAPLTLRGADPAERERRISAFNATVLARFLLMLYLVWRPRMRCAAPRRIPHAVPLSSLLAQVYPGVSVTIFSVFSCTKSEPSGISYLDADFNLQCYTPQHFSYVGAGIFWLFAVTLGIPAFFIWLLYRVRVPHMARTLTNNAFLKEAVQLAWQERLPQPDVDVRTLTVDNIATEHLEALCAFLVFGKSADEASDILAGRAPFVLARGDEKDADAEKSSPPAGVLGRLRAFATRVLAIVAEAAVAARARAAALLQAASARLSTVRADVLSSTARAEVERRNAVLAVLLAWCTTSGELSIPPLQWEEEEKDRHCCEPSEKEAPHFEKAAAAERDAINSAAAVARGDVLSGDIPALQERALRDTGFLFAQYRLGCWFWCACCASRAPHVLDDLTLGAAAPNLPPGVPRQGGR